MARDGGMFEGIRQALCHCGTGRCTHGTLIAAAPVVTIEDLQNEIAILKAMLAASK
jgi:hypothetical protein